ncbi:MAG TPA: response regulator [Thermoanaerobaculia bacterium]|nr:response regulator [Thermoanaerobaculia bacterium]
MTPNRISPCPRRLLVIDDEESILFAMWDFLTQRGYEVDQARSRREAEDLLETGAPYALVIADLRLDVSDPRGGLRILRRVRQSSPKTRTILLTAFGSPDVEAELAAVGADRLLSKPQPLERIAREVDLLLANGAAV